jgi:hypothetical protein
MVESRKINLQESKINAAAEQSMTQESKINDPERHNQSHSRSKSITPQEKSAAGEQNQSFWRVESITLRSKINCSGEQNQSLWRAKSITLKSQINRSQEPNQSF